MTNLQFFRLLALMAPDVTITKAEQVAIDARNIVTDAKLGNDVRMRHLAETYGLLAGASDDVLTLLRKKDGASLTVSLLS